MIDIIIETIGSIFILAQIHYYGEKRILGPIFGLLGAFVFWIVMIRTDAWGILLLNAATTYLHGRNLIKWS